MGDNLKERLDKLSREFKRRGEVIDDQNRLIVSLQREIETLEAVNERLEAENRELKRQLQRKERGPK